ncbi:MAG: UDP-N-acetylglucosamine 4,6-dehydratase [Verrucomicrobiota bacterium]
MDFKKIIGREQSLFAADVEAYESQLKESLTGSRCLVIGGAGTIGQAVVRELFRRDPAALHVIDISENNLVELVRDIRSTLGYGSGDFRVLPLDVGSEIYDSFIASQEPYDYVLNLSALKHVRSEKDPYTLMRLIDVNVFNTIKTARQAAQGGARKYFAVSTDKAANPVNLMGGSKRIMEKFLARESEQVPVSTARFANVAFSDGSLLHGFFQRLQKRQPLSSPSDVRRYFIVPSESGELCMLSCLLGENLDVFFPKEGLELTKFSDIAVSFLESFGFEPKICTSEDEARDSVEDCIAKKQWPLYLFTSDTTGEKAYEEFYMEGEMLDLERFSSLGVIKNKRQYDALALERFETGIARLRASDAPWLKEDLVELYRDVLPELVHEEKGKNLDQRM